MSRMREVEPDMDALPPGFSAAPGGGGLPAGGLPMPGGMPGGGGGGGPMTAEQAEARKAQVSSTGVGEMRQARVTGRNGGARVDVMWASDVVRG